MSGLTPSAPPSTWDDASAIDLLQRTVATPSLSGEERQVAQLLVDAASRSARRAFVDAAGNAVAMWGNGPLRVTFLGHMDTVPGRIPVRVENGVLHGRGAVDAKGALCTALVAALRSEERVWDALTFTFIGAVEEEASTSRGARFAVENYPAPDLLIVGEPSGWQRYTLGYKGRLGVTVHTRRPSAHSSREEPSAAELAVDAFNAVRAWVDAQNEADSGLFDRVQLSLLRMETRHDGLEETCQALISLRLPLRFTATQTRRAVAAVLPGADLEFTDGLDAHRAAPITELARAFRVAIRATGGRPEPVLKSGTSDMNVVAPVWSVPMLAYGPGDSNLDHAPDERLELAEYLRSIEVLTGVFEELARVPHPGRSGMK